MSKIKFKDRAARSQFLISIFRSGYLLREDIIQGRYEYRIRLYEFEGFIYYIKQANDRVTDILKICKV